MNRKAEKEEKREEFAPVGMQESKTICMLTPFAHVVGLEVKRPLEKSIILLHL